MLQLELNVEMDCKVISALNFEVSQFADALGIAATKIHREPAKIQHIDMTTLDCSLYKGDNIDALLCLLETPSNDIDFCYIDPPYNTGQNFVYQDSRQRGASKLWGKHEEWMSFMLTRIVLLKSLLKDSGIVAISIDDYEYHRLKTILDTVFGEDHHIATLIVMRSRNGKGSKAGVSVNHEYVIIFGKSKSSHLFGMPELKLEEYDKCDAHGSYKIDGLFRKKGDASLRSDRPNMFYPLFFDTNGNVFTEKNNENLRDAWPIDSKGIERRWLWGIDKARAESWKLYASKNGVIYVKNYLTEGKRVKVKSVWDDLRYLTEKATNEIKEIYGDKVFETPKPLGLIEDLIECCTHKNSLILDFFAGTGTTAHAAHLVNKKDLGNRKVILIEANLPTPVDHVSRKNGFKNIASITEARLKYISDKDHTFSFCTTDLAQSPLSASCQ